MSDPYGPEPKPDDYPGPWSPTPPPLGPPPPPLQPQPFPGYGQAAQPAYTGPYAPSPRRGMSSTLFILVMVVAVGVLSSITTLAVVGGSSSAPAATRPSVTSTGAIEGERQNLETVLDSVFTVAVRGADAGGTGSAVAIDEQHLVTNAHVVNLGGTATSKPTIEVQDSLGNEYPATLVGTDTVADLAVLRVDDVKLTPVPFGKSSDLTVGQGVVAVGAPLGLSNTVTSGIVSALNRPVRLGDEGEGEATEPATYVNAIQTDAAINRGNSGGPLLDTQGKLVGLNVAISSAEGSTGSIGIGYAIPVSYVKRVTKELIKNGVASHGLLNISVGTVGSESRFFEDGAVVQEVNKGGAADVSKLRRGDVIVGWDGAPVDSAGSLIGFAKASAPGSKATLTVRRANREIGVEVTLGSDLD